MSEYIDKTSNATKELMSISYELDNLSRAFFTTGNDIMAEKMNLLAVRVESCQLDIRKSMGENISDQLQRSQESTGNIMRACLAGALIQREAD